MKARIAILMLGAVLAGAALVGCGGDHGRSPPPTAPPTPPTPPAMTMNLDTTAVLAIIQSQTSETAEPFEVDGALIAVTPIGDETSPPQSVDAT
jgi:hypothetical protein